MEIKDQLVWIHRTKGRHYHFLASCMAGESDYEGLPLGEVLELETTWGKAFVACPICGTWKVIDQGGKRINE